MNVKEKLQKHIWLTILLTVILSNLTLVPAIYVLAQLSDSYASVIEAGSMITEARFVVFLDGSTYYGRNGNTGAIDYEGTNSTTVIQAVENIVDDSGGTIYLRNVELPLAVSLSSNVLVIEEYNGKTTYYNELSNRGVLEEYFADNAYFQTEIVDPRGIYYNGRTYIVYQGQPDLDPYITFFDHNKEVWATPVKVGDNPLTDDTHGTPCLAIDDNGRIHVFWGAHATLGTPKHSESTNPEDISSWTAMTDMAITTSTYPNVIKITNGSIYYFYRTTELPHGVERYVVSHDDGETWSAERTIVDHNQGAGTMVYLGNVALEAGSPDKIHVTWTHFAGGVVQDIFHAYLNTQDDKMYSQDGTDLGVTVDNTEAGANCKVYESGSDSSTSMRVRLNSANLPFILFASPYVDGEPNRYMFSRWNGTAWTSPVTIVNALAKSQPDLIVTGTSYIEVYLTLDGGYTPHNETWRGGDILRFVSSDSGATWSFNQTIMSQGQGELPPYNPQVILDHDSELKIVFVSGSSVYWGAEQFGFSTKIYAWGDKGFVCRRHYFDD